MSIYIPTHRVNEKTDQDIIRLKNSLASVERALVDGGMRTPEAEQLISPAEALLEDDEFWTTQSDGLALFLSADRFNRYRLPSRFKSFTAVSGRFHIKPLLPLVGDAGRYFVLALSLKDVRLMGGNEYAVDDIQAEQIPEGIAEALRYDDPERRLQFHTGTEAPAGGERAAQFHGHGVGTKDEKKDCILRCFQRVAEEVHAVIGAQDAPLVLAGVEYLLPIYRQASEYPHILERSITGNPDRMSHQEFHRQAWPLVEPLFREKRQEHLEQYYSRREDGRASNDVETVISAAYRGLVKAIFVSKEQELWGQYDAAQDRVRIDEGPDGANADLLDLAAARSIAGGGDAYALAGEEMPDGALIAAVFRDGIP